MLAGGQTTKGAVSNPAVFEPTFQSTRHLPLFPGVLDILKTTIKMFTSFRSCFFFWWDRVCSKTRMSLKREDSPTQAASA